MPDTERALAGIDPEQVTRWLAGHVGGQVLSDRAAGLALAPGARATAGEQVVDVLVALHALDPAEVGLQGLVRRAGYVERQLRRWHAQVHAAQTAEHTSPRALALLDEVHGLLARRVPAQGNGIVHGDFRPGNMAFGPCASCTSSNERGGG
jgi:aminoglycoside phosphotransferase (APT) family kinase protein